MYPVVVAGNSLSYYLQNCTLGCIQNERKSMDVIFGILIGLGVVIFGFLVVVPFYAATFGIFVNKPEGTKKSGMHFFTTIEPGQVKAIERNEKFVRMITDTPGKIFKRKGGPQEFWELVPAPDGGKEDPVVDVWLPIRKWAELVYDITGLVFIGIYPIQRVREYKLSRTKLTRRETGTETETSNLVLESKEDVSDHVRSKIFLFPMHIKGAETKDKIPLDIIGVAELEVTNPYLTAYNTDRWEEAIVNITTDKIASVTRQHDLDSILSAASEDDARRISKAVEGGKEDTRVCGINLVSFRVLEINPVLSEEERKSLRAEAIALQKAKATRVDGKARADVIVDINKAQQEGGDTARATMEAEAFVRAAEAASKGDGTIILMPNSGKSTTDPIQSAILSELKKLNRDSHRRTS